MSITETKTHRRLCCFCSFQHARIYTRRFEEHRLPCCSQAAEWVTFILLVVSLLMCHVTEQGTTITFLLRSTSVFDNDDQMQPFVRGGKAQLVRGDALNREDVSKAWQAAVEAGDGKVDLVLFTIGRCPSVSYKPNERD